MCSWWMAMLLAGTTSGAPLPSVTPPADWNPDNGDGTYTNPVLFADYSDPDVIRVEDAYYLVSSSFNHVPGLPVLQSADLVHWRIIGHALSRLPSPMYDAPRHGGGVWAPSIRYHDGEFWIYYGDPDLGIFLVKSKRPEGPWDPPVLVKQAKGWIDPCPLWDDDGSLYLVHAWAKSRAGFNSILTVNRLSPDGTKILDEGTTVFDGKDRQPTIEGPKFYKRNGFYYILAPAGGVKGGWQAALRSKSVYGPYEDRVVMDQGSTPVNGAHQGGWVETPGGESWFMHFQDRGAYGRVVYLEPMVWVNTWPVIGSDRNGGGKGEPVLRWKKPIVSPTQAAGTPATGDEFDSPLMGAQWQWEANPSDRWFSSTARQGCLRLYAAAQDSGANLWSAPNLLLQKFAAPAFTVTTAIDFVPANKGDEAGLLVFGSSYAFLSVSGDGAGLAVRKVSCADAPGGAPEVQEAAARISRGKIFMRLDVDSQAVCTWSYSDDGRNFQPLGAGFRAQAGRWVGAKAGLFVRGSHGDPDGAYADVEWWRVQ